MSLNKTVFYPGWICLEEATIHAITSEATGYPKERLLDGNLKKGWKPTSTANQDIWIDTNKTDLVSDTYVCGFFCKNYTTDHSNSAAATFAVLTSSVDSAGAGFLSGSISAAATPVQVFETATVKTPQRYMKFTFANLATTMEISHLFFGKKITVNQGPQLPMNLQDLVYNRTIIDPGGGRMVSAESRDYLSPEVRRYTSVNSTIHDNLRNVFLYSRGGRHLMVIVDYLDAVAQTARVIRLGDGLPRPSSDFDIYDITVQIFPQPYFTDGYNY